MSLIINRKLNKRKDARQAIVRLGKSIIKREEQFGNNNGNTRNYHVRMNKSNVVNCIKQALLNMCWHAKQANKRVAEVPMKGEQHVSKLNLTEYIKIPRSIDQSIKRKRLIIMRKLRPLSGALPGRLCTEWAGTLGRPGDRCPRPRCGK